MSHIPNIKPPPTPAEAIADAIIDAVNAEVARRFAIQMTQYRALFDSPIPPDEIVEAMGSRAQQLFADWKENIEHLTTLAAIEGKTLDQLISLEFILPRRAFIPGDDGTVTLAPPAPGHDAWGRPVQQQNPEPQPEPVDGP